MNIAVIGSGISGLSTAWLLNRSHEVTLYEAADYLGGHTNTVDVTLEGRSHPVDTGFLVHNDLTYPNLIKLFEHLGVETYDSDMSFSVSIPDQDLEWAGTNLATVFGQRANLLRWAFWRMVFDLLRFNRRAESALIMSERNRWNLQQLLQQDGYSEELVRWYLLPMAAAIWSSSPRDILQFPAATFLRFCLNHKLLQVEQRPQWRTILGGGRSYVEKMAADLDVKLKHPVTAVKRDDFGVDVHAAGNQYRHDAVIFATHAPDTLAMLQDADADEKQLLGAVNYQANTAILHTDRRFLPKRQSVWSAWNYLATESESQPVCVTYLLNRLQRLPFETPLLLTLNPPREMMPQGEIRRFEYDHPVFDQAAIDAQQQLSTIQGLRRTWFCGAWCGYGFHEDGLKSALRVVADFDVEVPWAVEL